MSELRERVLERFLRYVRIDTQSDEKATSYPSTEKQYDLLRPLVEELKAIGVDQFAVYLQHDAKDQTLQAYGEKIIPAVAEHVKAKS